MLKYKRELFIFYLLHIILFLGILWVNKDNNTILAVINTYYQNIFTVCSFFSLSNLLIFKNISKKMSIYFYLKSIVYIPLFLIIISFLMNAIVIVALNYSSILLKLLLINIQLFLILTLISFITFLFYIGKDSQAKDEKNLIFVFLFQYILYCFIYYYGDNIILFNIYRFYIKNNFSLASFFYYFIWLFILTVFIYIRYKPKKV